jgi:hypothetical protein
MVTEIAKKGTQDLNMFPNAHGVCEHVSPLSLVTGKNTPDYNSMKIEFGSYAQVFEDNDPTNTNKARTVGAIALTATGNTNGDHYFMSLATGSRISRQQWTELPITDNAIARVEALAASEGQPLIQERGLVIEWRPGHVIDDDEYDRDYVQGEHKDDDHGDEDDMEQYDPVDEGEIEDIQAPEGHDAINNGAVDQFVHDPAGEEFDDFHRQFDDENQLIADDQNDHEAQGDNGLLDAMTKNPMQSQARLASCWNKEQMLTTKTREHMMKNKEQTHPRRDPCLTLEPKGVTTYGNKRREAEPLLMLSTNRTAVSRTMGPINSSKTAFQTARKRHPRQWRSSFLVLS